MKSVAYNAFTSSSIIYKDLNVPTFNNLMWRALWYLVFGRAVFYNLKAFHESCAIPPALKVLLYALITVKTYEVIMFLCI